MTFQLQLAAEWHGRSCAILMDEHLSSNSTCRSNDCRKATPHVKWWTAHQTAKIELQVAVSQEWFLHTAAMPSKSSCRVMLDSTQARRLSSKPSPRASVRGCELGGILEGVDVAGVGQMVVQVLHGAHESVIIEMPACAYCRNACSDGLCCKLCCYSTKRCVLFTEGQALHDPNPPPAAPCR